MQREWPEPIARKVTALLGPNPDMSTVGGMSGASVTRLRGNGASLNLKRSGSPREWNVYTRLGETLHAAGVAIPELFAEAIDGESWWLLLEDIGQALPRDRWLADPDVIGMLRNLHTIPLTALDLPNDRFQPDWSEELTRQALSLVEKDLARTLVRQLARIRLDCQPLFEPRCLISGDPNPANWGVRDDGSPVLYDWERCTLGTPAIDLAITVPGLGNMAAYNTVSIAYAGNTRLAADIARAKVWSGVEFLAGCAEGSVRPAFDLTALLEQIPGWLSALDFDGG